MRPITTWAGVAVLALGLAAPTASVAIDLDPAVLAYKLPDQIVWQKNPRNPGAENVTLYGDPEKPGIYVVLVKWLSGNNFSRPHWHPNDRFIRVLSGTWWVGTGGNFDPNNSVPMPAGSFVIHYGKQVHWDGAKDQEAVLQIVGEGPATTNPFIPPK